MPKAQPPIVLIAPYVGGEGMTTPAKMALEYFVGQQRAWSGTDKAAFYDTAVAALKVLDEVQRNDNIRVSIAPTSEFERGYDRCISHLKQIAGE